MADSPKPTSAPNLTPEENAMLAEIQRSRLDAGRIAEIGRLSIELAETQARLVIAQAKLREAAAAEPAVSSG